MCQEPTPIWCFHELRVSCMLLPSSIQGSADASIQYWQKAHGLQREELPFCLCMGDSYCTSSAMHIWAIVTAAALNLPLAPNLQIFVHRYKNDLPTKRHAVKQQFQIIYFEPVWTLEKLWIWQKQPLVTSNVGSKFCTRQKSGTRGTSLCLFWYILNRWNFLLDNISRACRLYALCARNGAGVHNSGACLSPILSKIYRLAMAVFKEKFAVNLP